MLVKSIFGQALLVPSITRVLALLIAIWTCADALAQESGVKIRSLAMNKAFPGLVFIEAETAKSVFPACHTNTGWAFVLRVNDADDRRLYAALAAAVLSQRAVRLGGNGQCDAFPSVESLDRMDLLG